MTRAEFDTAVDRQKLGFSHVEGSDFYVCFDPDAKKFYVVELVD